MAATITVGGSQGQSTLFLSGNSDVPDVTFDVVLTNPCITASIDNISFATSPLSVADGSTGTSTFTIPQDDVDKSNTVQDLCGTKEYVVKDSSSNIITTWASIALSTTTARTYILTIDTTQYPTHVTSDTTEVLTITTTLASWVTNGGNTASTISVTITTTACDCSKLGWTIPALVTSSVQIDGSVTPTVNTPVADTSNSDFDFLQCYEDSGTCATTGTYTASSDFTYNDGSSGDITLPGWITFNTGT
jgi:hypothetical protein